MKIDSPLNSFRTDLHQKASELNRSIVLPESESARVLVATEEITNSKIARVILLGNQAEILSHADKLNVSLDGVQIQSVPEGSTPHDFGAGLVQDGMADGCVCGIQTSTAHVVRSALEMIGCEDKQWLTSSFLMVHPKHDKQVMFCDGGVIIDPDADTLVHIAKSSCDTYQFITGESPRVAFLSFSTKGSAKHDSVEKMRSATQIFRDKYPDIPADGELQFDAAFDPVVAEEKAKGSTVAGQANIFVFPDLNAANIAYKVAERMGHYRALGPILQGLNKPMMDLSRGCGVRDIVDMAALCCLLNN